VFAEAKSQLPVDREESSDDGAAEFLVDQVHFIKFGRILARVVIRSLLAYPGIPSCWRLRHASAW
jgi:hypothetical protein